MSGVAQRHNTSSTRPAKMASNQSLNHLLNFSLPPRQPNPLPRRSRKTTSAAVWNKERFVNAQYRFVMNPAGDYTVHFADPDIFFQWNDILQVIIPRSSALASTTNDLSSSEEGHTTCPICLSPPTAPRMTKCGHVFCFPCILHYLSMTENKWARCPICFDSVNDHQLKCVKWLDHGIPHDQDELPASSSSSSSYTIEDAPRSGSNLRMRLMQRPQITTLALPRSSTWPSDLLPPHQAPFHFLPDVFTHAKFMLATPEYLMADLSHDLDELATEKRILKGMNDELGIVYIDVAEQKIRNQMVKAAALETQPLNIAIDKARREVKELEGRAAYHAQKAREEMVAVDAPQELLATKLPVETPRTNPRQRRNLNPPPPSTSTYYYYQAASGLPVFLHPLDIRILFSHFNSYSAFPNMITIRVESVSEGSVNDDLRKRCKYLSHMPEGADVVFVEADLKAVVGEDGLKAFEGPLRMRRNRRKDKERKDDRAKQRAEERERDRELAAAARWTPSRVSPNGSTPIHSNSPMIDEVIVPAQPQPQQLSGAWGNRSFASALHSPSTPRNNPTPARTVDDDWDIDAAWHEMEQRASGGRKKRANKLLVLGSGGGRRR